MKAMMQTHTSDQRPSGMHGMSHGEMTPEMRKKMREMMKKRKKRGEM